MKKPTITSSPSIKTRRKDIFPFILFFVSIGARLNYASSFSISTRRKDTKVKASGKATANVTPPPHALSDDVAVTKYMRLPVEQYVLIPMPLGSTLTRVKDECKASNTKKSLSNGEEFELVVPTIKFFNLSVQPVVYASVFPENDRVVISSDKCLLRGSPFIDKVKLNDRFDFRVCTTLTWMDSLSTGKNQTRRIDTDPQYSLKQPSPDSETSDICSIIAETYIDVDVNVPPPFNSLPKLILESTGNAAMKLSMQYIQGNFVKNLANDYEKWATNQEYRSYRASLSERNLSEDLVELGELV